MTVPMRVDLGGGWLDVPSLAIEGGYIVNCAVTPGIEYPWQYGGGMGGSAAAAIRDGKNAFQSELKTAGWQDPAVITETGLCVWRSGPWPVLDMKVNPGFLRGLMAVWWTGIRHDTGNLLGLERNYRTIARAGSFARAGAIGQNIIRIAMAVRESYKAQLAEGMMPLPPGGMSKKYLGSGHGGYALYLFSRTEGRDTFVKEHNGIPVEPYMENRFWPCQGAPLGDKAA